MARGRSVHERYKRRIDLTYINNRQEENGKKELLVYIGAQLNNRVNVITE